MNVTLSTLPDRWASIVNGQQFGLLRIDAFPDLGKRLINDAVLASNAPGRFIQTRATTPLESPRIP
ncbi:MAG: hypothetical protein HYY98_13875 [Burkholderiales bacterium]|nr:hypothetical protein [Burkholderiales bacterium]